MNTHQTERRPRFRSTSALSEPFEQILAANGFKRNTRSWTDYEAAKRLINRMAMSAEHYDQMIRSAVDYLGL